MEKRNATSLVLDEMTYTHACLPYLSTREARIRLVTECNYRCFFCHEGGGCSGPKAEWKTLRPLLLALKAQGRTDLTFTGGEPLLNKPVLLKALDEIASWDVQPQVTLVTNATRMDESVVAALERCRRAKVHVSVHNPRPGFYQKITGSASMQRTNCVRFSNECHRDPSDSNSTVS